MSIRYLDRRNDEMRRAGNPSISLQNSASISLRCLFQILTACCVFFACLGISPTFTLIGTLLFSPAIIRTAWASDLYRRQCRTFCWKTRLQYFVGSLGVVVSTIVFGGLVFLLICLVFALLGCLFGLMLSTDMILESVIVGIAGGMIWGMAGALLAIMFAAIRMGTLKSISGPPNR